MSRETILKLVKVNHDRLRKLGVRELGSFGSYARGDARPDSDVDFFVDHEEKSFDRYMMLGHAWPAANSITFRVAVHRFQHQRALSKSIDQYVGPIVQWTIRLHA